MDSSRGRLDSNRDRDSHKSKTQTQKMDSARMANKRQLMMTRKRKVGWPKRMFALRKHKMIRRWLLRNPWMRPMTVFNMAAVKIQSVMRRFLCIKYAMMGTLVARTRQLSKKSSTGGSKKGVTTHRQLDRYLSMMEYYSRRQYTKPAWMDGGFSSWCAVRIQSWFRMTRYRRRYHYKNRITNQIAALVIQSAYRNIQFRRMKRRMMTNMSQRNKHTRSEHDCALCIQLKWRSYCNVRVYRYFRELIVNKLHGAPHELLRAVIPNESALLDRAAGVHVRFRLAGSVFPPKIVFKIYTHRPLCDVNAFAPRNYIEEREVTTSERFNKPSAIKSSTSKMRVGMRYFETVVTSNVPMDHWYQREERNPWRPISSQLLLDLFAPLQMGFGAPANQILAAILLGGMQNQRKPLHYSQLQRKYVIVELYCLL
jgi:hypothetical protein